ncbi:MAG: bifunctional methionine sulfoxide reductase B/A protein [Myxococcales bacterium]|nr:bifunctional methionine sulfoxide reductase B/A protein [Myxococcales bacterium]
MAPRRDREALRSRLNPLQYRVTQLSETEPPFENEHWDNHEPGLYVDLVSGEALFASIHKFDSGSGWPSFLRPVEEANVSLREDRSHGMERIEVRSREGNSHLGHVFEDGPGPGGLRYCVNSAALRFIPVDRLEAEGYGRYAPLFAQAPGAAGAAAGEPEPADLCPGCELATLAGGCFWGVEEILRRIPGVVDTEVGYTGGRSERPRYSEVRGGQTGHAEAVRVRFDPARLSYAALLEHFFRLHDPTTPNRQGNDTGTQYRSAIFVHSAEQEGVARQARDAASASGRWEAPIVTEIVAAGPFTPAEAYHQDYLVRNPSGYTCHYLRD